MKKISKEEKEKKKYLDDLIMEVENDFEKRKKARLGYERQWQLNMNFLSGNQYCYLNTAGDIEGENKNFYWQSRGVYNHIAPIIDSRQAKFSRIETSVSVRPRTDDDKDIAAASLAEKLIENAFKSSEFTTVIKKVTAWSESCGTGFYKVVWNNNGGQKLGTVDGTEVFEGEADVLPVSPFEIFPDNLYTENLEDCKSIIHARVMTVGDVYEKYGVAVTGGKVGVYSLTKSSAISDIDDTVDNACVVIERYEKPSKNMPGGRLITVAGGKLLYIGELPYINGAGASRSFPFVKQECLTVAGSFFGVSIVERLIPVQRAFNAVKNRKHEFMNRLSMGLLAVEDGSVDVDDLAEDGLSPGKVLVYRQGSKAPEIMSDMTMPDDFKEEEYNLLNEFVIVSGVSDVVSSSSNAAVSSGTALQILVEQDNSRLLMTAEEIRRAIVEVAKQTVRLYAQFTEGIRAVTGKDESGKTHVYYADSRAVGSDDVYLDSENELLYTNSQKKEMIFKLYDSGLLTDEEGKLRPAVKEKVLSLLGYKDLDYQKGLSRLHEEKALTENELLLKKDVVVEEIDDDAVHIDEHTRFVLSEYSTLNEEQKQRFYAHIGAHKNKINAIGE